MVVVNLEGVVAGFELLPEATVDGRLTKTTFKKSKSSDSMNANLEFVIDSAAGEPWAGRKAFVTLPTSEKGLGITKKALIDMGLDPSQLEGRVNLAEAFEALAGADVRIRIGIEQYQGQDRNRFNIVSPDSWAA